MQAAKKRGVIVACPGEPSRGGYPRKDIKQGAVQVCRENESICWETYADGNHVTVASSMSWVRTYAVHESAKREWWSPCVQ